MNTISFIGRLAQDPEISDIKTKVDGKTKKVKLCKFAVAVKRFPKNEKEPCDFLPCVAWDKKAELIDEYFSKGSQIGIVGELHSHKYEAEIIDPKTKKKKTVNRTSFDILVTDITFCESESKSKDDDDEDDEDEDDEDEEDEDEEFDGTNLPFDV